MSEYIVEMKNITKKFPGIVANDNVTIQVKKGEIYAILGENGAGKSTLMSMLFGMYEPDSGEIYINGKKEEIKSPNHATDLNIGMVHQHFKLVSNYTVAENIVMGIEPKKRVLGFLPYVDMKTANEKVRKISTEYGLEVDPKKKIEDLNVSIQQRVEILKMLYRESEILIFDEPTAVLTPQEIEYLLKIIVNLKNSGKTILLITHKLEEIKKVADRCAILRRGKLVDVVNTNEVTTKDMSNLMVGRDIETTLEKKEASFKDTVLEVENLNVKNSEKIKVVKDVSFNVHGGEIMAIAGVSGNGQIELADAIAGMLEVESGTIKLNGKDITNLSIRERNVEGIAYIPEDRQNVGLIMNFNLNYNLSSKNYYKKEFSKNGVLNYQKFKEYGKKLIEKYDIRSSQGGNTIVRSMSGGNQQKVIIGREIEQDTPLLIFVQPTRGLDVGAVSNIHKYIIEERDRGKAILLISLELEEVMNLADTIGVIYNGELLKVEDASKMTSTEVGAYMMGVKKS
ncbi:MAG: ABC transporter ATP-binding protein [Miniphocaeibacter sp.]|uniref:ABC transporter ATP-binding protein n=1 Tax=Miniphocaeibacter sp. TaxID=3100973 RepID=UPI00179B76E4|nr:ABC transporter ATP-binding protein [Gallicola sp.]